MAPKPVKLKCTISLENDHSYTVRAKMYDGTPFHLTASSYDLQMNEEFLPSKRTVAGWLFVQQESEQSGRVYITLPKPTIAHGHHLVVNKLDLMPRYATLADFGVQKGDTVVASMVEDVKRTMAATKKKKAKVVKD